MPSADTVVKCLRCGTERAFGACPNCGNRQYKYRIGAVACSRCDDFRPTWICICGTYNPIEKTMKNDCFIATAAYGTALADEVVVLRKFRDQNLRHTRWGMEFIKLYERLSPHLAKWIAKRKTAKLLTRKILLNPLVKIISVFIK